MCTGPMHGFCGNVLPMSIHLLYFLENNIFNVFVVVTCVEKINRGIHIHIHSHIAGHLCAQSPHYG
jgi:hypothetical protein